MRRTATVSSNERIMRDRVPSPITDNELSAGAIVFVSQAAPEYPIGNARAVAPARFVALPLIAYRLARAAAGDGVAPCGCPADTKIHPDPGEAVRVQGSPALRRPPSGIAAFAAVSIASRSPPQTAVVITATNAAEAA